MLLVDHGKTNQYSKPEYGAAIQHRDPFVCPVSALAFCLAWMLHVEKETFINSAEDKRQPFFNFAAREDWYRLHILHGGKPDRNAQWEYDSHKRMYQKAFPKVR
jgi:hypothetical protein